MSLNFFERRKVLKEINSLDLTPIRQKEFEMKDNGKVDILLPRFKNPVLKRALQSRRKDEYIRIHLDDLGSAIWLQIDGKMNVHELCSQLQSTYPEKLNPPEETEERVAKFLSLLYRERYLTFREITKEKNPSAGK